ncbi:hypothetical protein [Salinicoccus roseus]|uniref:Uncharacterized protein n=1 Tax=Salinicoccus roseus TaxID=45670 RepID=A0A0C2DLX7_9STAP|nr:hypothetical protein [Salinicoccus roseus]KIH71018.1 hypothetical protein SN16_05520 [Salinicoccus roseus]MBY8908794.1 hypothetical protein [Salinicoccus roseus]MDB0580246.1 hypothetical protein [Salinicoccus roseus]OZT78339.1 hypothetical protein CFN03_03405 [Salinicoccus roseus]RPE54424.1 hypothetical protein EDC33_0679 [Salinicoccus roseus]
MIFNKVELNGTTYDIDGQLRIKEDNVAKIIFEDIMFGNNLKDLHTKQSNIDHLVLKNTDETRYDTKNVKVSHITIDGKFYHATFK